MRVIVAGSRDLSARPFIHSMLDCVEATRGITEIVCGECRGPDKDGKLWAESNSKKVKSFIPDWNKYKKAAGPILNKQMAENADMLMLFWMVSLEDQQT